MLDSIYLDLLCIFALCAVFILFYLSIICPVSIRFYKTGKQCSLTQVCTIFSGIYSRKKKDTHLESWIVDKSCVILEVGNITLYHKFTDVVTDVLKGVGKTVG